MIGMARLPYGDFLMESRTVSSLRTAAPHHDVGRCLLAIELSKASWIVGVPTPLSDKISRYALGGCDWKGLLELIGESVSALLGSLARQWK